MGAQTETQDRKMVLSHGGVIPPDDIMMIMTVKFISQLLMLWSIDDVYYYICQRLKLEG